MRESEATEFRKIRAKPPISRREQAARLLWSFIQATLFRCSFHTWNRWRAMLLRWFGANIGPGCTIRRTASVYYPWKLSMGAVACLGDRCDIYNLGQISIGDRALISQDACICAGTHDYRLLSMPLVCRPVVIGTDAWICARAFVGPGVTVGEGAVVGAASVVMRDVAAWTIVMGNPAVFVKQREQPK